jgi:hypothetical protein
LALVLASACVAQAQAPDTILINGKVVRYDAVPAEALAVRGAADRERAAHGPAGRRRH